MKGIRDFIANRLHILDSFRHAMLPQKFVLPGRSMKLLHAVYPEVDWSSVNFYLGLPWFMRMFSPKTTAVTLPATFGVKRLHVFFRDFKPHYKYWIGTFIHEGYHVFQYRALTKGVGPGFLKHFVVLYLASFFKTGYRKNPFEVPAYEYEAIFLRCYDKLNEITKEDIPEDTLHINISSVMECNKPLVNKDFQIRYEYGLLRFIGGFLLALVITIVKPFIDIFLFILGFIGVGIYKLVDLAHKGN